MTTYYITLFLVIIFASLAQSNDFPNEGVLLSGGIVEHTRSTKRLFVVVAIILIIVGGFRYGVGVDYFNYYNGGIKFAEGFAEALKNFDEPGIRLMYLVIQKFTSSKIVPILIFQIMTVGLSLRVIYRNTDQLLAAVLLYIFLGCWHGAFNAVRQCLAATIVFCGFSYLRERKLLKYALIVFIAFLFHRSAIIMIVPYFVVNRKISVKNAIIIIVSTIFVLLSYDRLITFTGFIMGGDISGTGAYGTTVVNIFRILIAVAPAAFYLLLYAGKPIGVNVAFFINLTIIHAIVMILGAKSAYIARVGIYTSPFVALAIPELNKGIEDYRTRRLLTFIILLLYGFTFFYDIYKSGSLNTFRWWNTLLDV